VVVKSLDQDLHQDFDQKYWSRIWGITHTQDKMYQKKFDSFLTKTIVVQNRFLRGFQKIASPIGQNVQMAVVGIDNSKSIGAVLSSDLIRLRFYPD